MAIRVLVYDSLDGELRILDTVDGEDELMHLVQLHPRPCSYHPTLRGEVLLENMGTDLPISVWETSAGRERKYYAFEA